MKKNIVLLFTFLSFCGIHLVAGQVSIQIGQPNPLRARPGDLFNASVTNSTGQTLRLYLIGTIEDGRGKQVAAARTRVDDYPVGYKQLSEAALSPVYTFYDQLVQQTGFLPYGDYEFCLKAFVEDKPEDVGSACATIAATPMSPPLLLQPENEAEIQTPNPLLVWLPPAPINPALGVNFDLKLVELLPNQTPYDAVQRNLALIDEHGLRGTNLQYPANAMKLEEHKVYAWRIVAKTGDGKPAGETEVWTFSLSTAMKEELAKEKVKTNDMSYVRMKTAVDADFISVSEEIRIIYTVTGPAADMTFNITDMNKKRVSEIDEGNVKDMGDNHYSVKLNQGNNLRKGTFYILEAQARNKDKQYILFKYQ